MIRYATEAMLWCARRFGEPLETYVQRQLYRDFRNVFADPAAERALFMILNWGHVNQWMKTDKVHTLTPYEAGFWEGERALALRIFEAVRHDLGKDDTRPATAALEDKDRLPRKGMTNVSRERSD